MNWEKVITSLRGQSNKDLSAAADAEFRRDGGQAMLLRLAAIQSNRIANALEFGLTPDEVPLEEPKRRTGTHQKEGPKKRGRPPKINRSFVGDNDFRPRN